MIRINLLPTRDAPRRQAAYVQIIVFVVVTAFAFVIAAWIDFSQQDQIRLQRRANGMIEESNSRIKQQIRDHDQILSRIEEFDSKQAVINRLQNGRTGPVMVMVELSKILSRNGSPTMDHYQYMEMIHRRPRKGYDPNWDGRRLWIREFREEAREVELNGLALSHEDVAELLRRMSLSDYFDSVTLVETRAADENESDITGPYGPSLVSFEIRCQLRYAGRRRRTAEEEEQPDSETGA